MVDFTIKILITLCAFIPLQISGQEIDNTATWKNIGSGGYLRIYVDNDYFTGTDEQYTEGLNIELCMPWVKRFFLTRLLLRPRWSELRCGLGLEQAGYTPHDLQNTGLPVNDRPFCGTLFLKTFSIDVDSARKRWLATTLSTGVMGPWAMARRLQDGVHEMIEDVQPPGWKHQIRNDVLLNYQVHYEQQLAAVNKYLLATGTAMAQAGTFSDKAGVGITLMAGYFRSPFQVGYTFRSKVQVYVFENPEVDVVGWDASLEGGPFSANPYTIRQENMSTVQFINRCGLAIVGNRFYLAYADNYLTKQFSYGPYHLWGSVQLGIGFNEGARLKRY